MIAVYTRSTSLFSKEFWKWTARRVIGKYSGPSAVEDSLLRGLKELHMPFTRNQQHYKTDVAVVLSGPRALKEAIAAKKTGAIKKLIAGPNVVTHPMEHGGLICNKLIDKILVPSEWVADFWTHEVPDLADKLVIWPAGVKTSKASTHTGKPIIYDKLGNSSLLAQIQDQLDTEAIIFTYGSFKRKAYLEALADAPFLIYLSQSESQGLALQEAWAHDVPTLVNKNTVWKSGDLSWETDQINCPYLTLDTGIIFTEADELPTLIKQLSVLHPKSYCDEHLSDRTCAKKLLGII